MNEENPSTDATFDRLLDELHGIQSGQSYAAALEWTSRLRAGLDALESLAVRDAVLNAHLSTRRRSRPHSASPARHCTTGIRNCSES